MKKNENDCIINYNKVNYINLYIATCQPLMFPELQNALSTLMDVVVALLKIIIYYNQYIQKEEICYLKTEFHSF
ncbi:hypothetical protein RN84_02890 [Fusobacterium nucleatum subsp. nucleatum]|nr:hypothetical protein RN84_02890 [Fusobacterium nucleatum subsp. nucleatum]